MSTGEPAMPPSLTLDQIENLPHKPASDVKRVGWRGVMQTVGREGKVVVTNHRRPEAVILSIDEYDAIRQALQRVAARSEPALEAPRRPFAERLASLQAPDASARPREQVADPARPAG